MNCTSCGKNVRITLRHDDKCVACRWIVNHEKVAADWFDDDLDKAEEVLDALPYSKIPDWGDVDRVLWAIKRSEA